MKHLPPVGGKIIWKAANKKDIIPGLVGKLFLKWFQKGFQKSFKLIHVMRQEGDGQKRFREVLSNIGKCLAIWEDFDFLKTRFFSKARNPSRKVYMVLTNAQVAEKNIVILKIQARENTVFVSDALFPSTFTGSRVFDNMERFSLRLILYKGLNIMITRNISVANWLVNETIGVIFGFY